MMSVVNGNSIQLSNQKIIDKQMINENDYALFIYVSDNIFKTSLAVKSKQKKWKESIYCSASLPAWIVVLAEMMKLQP